MNSSNRRIKNTNSGRRPRNRNANKVRNGPRNRELSTVSIPKNLRVPFPFPESRIVTVATNLNFVMQGAATFFVRDYRINSLFNFDLTGGGTNDFSGVTQLAAIYDSYHVSRIRVKFNLTGNETAQPVFFGVTFKDDQPSVSITTFAKTVNALEVAPTTGPLVVGQTNAMSIFRTQWYQIQHGSVVGNPLSYNADQSYTAAFGANPNQSVWMGLVAYGVGGNLTGGVIVQMSVELTLRAYSLKTLQE